MKTLVRHLDLSFRLFDVFVPLVSTVLAGMWTISQAFLDRPLEWLVGFFGTLALACRAGSAYLSLCHLIRDERPRPLTECLGSIHLASGIVAFAVAAAYFPIHAIACGLIFVAAETLEACFRGKA